MSASSSDSVVVAELSSGVTVGESVGSCGAAGVAVAVGEAVGGVGGALGDLAGDALRGQRPPAGSPLSGVVSEQRRFTTVRVSLADLKAVRAEHEHTINDVVLAVISGGVRTWLLTRGESVTAGSSLTALVPMSVTEEEGEPTIALKMNFGS